SDWSSDVCSSDLRRMRTELRSFRERRQRVFDPPVPQLLAPGGDQIVVSGHPRETACASTRSAPDAREARAEQRRAASCCSGIPKPICGDADAIVAARPDANGGSRNIGERMTV